MRVLVTGASGQLGHDVMNELIRRGHDAIGADRSGEDKNGFKCVKLDITDKDRVVHVISEEKPEAIIHCAAWTNVDAAEDPENYDEVMNINVAGTENLVLAAKQIDAKMMYISTDYVFDGRGEKPWKPEDENFAPQNVYGKSKLMGEEIVEDMIRRFFIVRIAWVFGANGKNFVQTMLNLAKTHAELRVVDDQIGTPTYTVDLARLLVDMIETDKYGVYHVTNEGGYISWADFAEEIFRCAGVKTKVVRVTSDEYGEVKAKRPLNSRLDKIKLSRMGFSVLPTWQDALRRYLNE